MDIREFAELIIENLEGKIPSVAAITYKSVLRNNSVELTGLLFRDKERNVTPTIYLEPYFERYEQGMELDEIIERIVQLYGDASFEYNLDVEQIKNWEIAKKKVAYKLINTKRNQELLADVPHKEYLDLSIVFYLCMCNGEGSVLIHNNHCEMWGIDVDDLWQMANQNTPFLKPARFMSMACVLEEMMEEVDEQIQKALEEKCGMYVLSNESKVMGAAVILYPEKLKTIAEYLNESFYVLPSSIHECLVLKASNVESAEQLAEMVNEVNATSLEPDEVLGDHAYYFSREEGKLSIAA